jgi:myo-inositol-1(or 4)-monophosphatase
MTPLTPLMDAAIAAARRGGEVIRNADRGAAAVAKGLPGDWVTEVDLASERAIATLLAEVTPGIAFRGEEGGGDASAPRSWVVDPLDGTTNFVHGFPVVGVSVALVEDGRSAVGCVHAPFLGTTWVAARGEGAWEITDRGPMPVRVSQRPVDRAVVGTGYPFRRKELLPRYLRAMTEALITFEDLRRPGAACLDLAWVAAGVFDGFFELALSPWDVAAGGLLIEEAGGVVTDWEGRPDYLPGTILAGSPAVHRALLAIAGEEDPRPS